MNCAAQYIRPSFLVVRYPLSLSLVPWSVQYYSFNPQASPRSLSICAAPSSPSVSLRQPLSARLLLVRPPLLTLRMSPVSPPVSLLTPPVYPPEPLTPVLREETPTPAVRATPAVVRLLTMGKMARMILSPMPPPVRTMHRVLSHILMNYFRHRWSRRRVQFW